MILYVFKEMRPQKLLQRIINNCLVIPKVKARKLGNGNKTGQQTDPLKYSSRLYCI